MPPPPPPPPAVSSSIQLPVASAAFFRIDERPPPEPGGGCYNTARRPCSTTNLYCCLNKNLCVIVLLGKYCIRVRLVYKVICSYITDPSRPAAQAGIRPCGRNSWRCARRRRSCSWSGRRWTAHVHPPGTSCIRANGTSQCHTTGYTCMITLSHTEEPPWEVQYPRQPPQPVARH